MSILSPTKTNPSGGLVAQVTLNGEQNEVGGKGMDVSAHDSNETWLGSLSIPSLCRQSRLKSSSKTSSSSTALLSLHSSSWSLLASSQSENGSQVGVTTEQELLLSGS